MCVTSDNFYYNHIFSRAMAIMKARLKGAQKGHSLLKKKSDALTMRFRLILKKIIEVSKLKTIKNATSSSVVFLMAIYIYVMAISSCTGSVLKIN